jgi:hypothetical protein
MKIFLAAVGFLIFLSATVLGLVLLNLKMLSGGEFVTLMVAFAVIGSVICFAAEVQEFSIVGNLVKLREVKTEVVASLETLKKTQSEILRLLLHTKNFIDARLAMEKGITAIGQDFWRIVEEAARIGATNHLKADMLNLIESMLQTLYVSTTVWGGPPRRGIQDHATFAEIAAELLDPEIISGTVAARSESDIDKYRSFVVGRLSDMQLLYDLQKKLLVS